MDRRSGFWQVDLTPHAQEPLAFITPQGRVFKWKVTPFGVASAPTLFQELMNKILSILQRRPEVAEFISRKPQMEAHIDGVCLGTNTQEDHLILLGEFFAVCEENHTRLKLEKCEFMQETMQYPGFNVGYGWWTPAASKAKPLMDAKVRHEDPKKGLNDVRSFIGACNFYHRHIKNLTYTSAILTDVIKKSTTWCWGPQEQQTFDELKDKVANAKCLAVPRAQGGIILVTDASNVGGGGTLFPWQALEKEECRSCKPGDIRDRGLYVALLIPHSANSVLYVDYTGMPKFGNYNFALVVTCGLTRFTRVFPCTKHITGEETIQILLEEWFCVYGSPKEDQLRWGRSSTFRYRLVQEGPEIPQCPGVYGDPLLSHEQPSM